MGSDAKVVKSHGEVDGFGRERERERESNEYALKCQKSKATCHMLSLI